jgi:hypothetical protein
MGHPGAKKGVNWAKKRGFLLQMLGIAKFGYVVEEELTMWRFYIKFIILYVIYWLIELFWPKAGRDD